MRRLFDVLRPGPGAWEPSAPTPSRARLLAVLPAALLVVPLAYGALCSFPAWDDGTVWFQLKELGPPGIRAGHADRPLMGWIWAALAARGVLWPAATVLYVGVWLATGAVAARLWAVLFPSLRGFAALAGCIAVAPILCETQLILVNPVLTGQLGMVAVYGALLLVVEPSERPAARVLAPVAASLAVLAAALLSEYALLSALGAGTTLFGRALADPDRRRRRRRMKTIAALGAAALAGYVLFLSVLSPAGLRPEIRPEGQLSAAGLRRLAEVPPRLPFALWSAAGGELLRKLGAVTLWSGSVWGVPAGIGLAAVLLAIMGRRPPEAALAREDHRRGLFVALGVAAALIPVIAVLSSPRGGHASRVWQPVLPLAACLTLYVLLAAVQPRFRLALGLLCGFLAGYLCVNAAAAARRIERQTADLGARLHERLSPSGLTVAIFSDFPANPWVGSIAARPAELTARLTMRWPDADRRRFWAGVYTWPPLRGHLPGLEGLCSPPRSLRSESRGWKRQGAITKILWVSYTPDGELVVAPEPGCPAGPRPGG